MGVTTVTQGSFTSACRITGHLSHDRSPLVSKCKILVRESIVQMQSVREAQRVRGEIGIQLRDGWSERCYLPL